MLPGSAVWHGILVDAAFVDGNALELFPKFAEKRDDGWTITGVIIAAEEFEAAIHRLQSMMRKREPFYLHFYNDKQLVVVFEDRIFRVTPERSSWSEILVFGHSRSIPSEQLDFNPKTFADEQGYFSAAQFPR